jgi:exopolyphosphatase/guanosine-5'-triphosphate,3'-diphosphate pyrophosphatase
MPDQTIGSAEVTVRKLAEACDPDPRHTSHVTALALALFDALRELHRLGTRPRRLLSAAARLHDVGWAGKSGGGHHKRSRDMILDAVIGMPGKDLQVCALVARYHTKAEPDASRHRRFAALDQVDREVVQWLAGVLRVADGLDCAHSCRVGLQGCGISRDRIVLSVGPAGKASPEIAAAAKKAGLLGKVSGRKVEFRARGGTAPPVRAKAGPKRARPGGDSKR